MTNGYLTPGRRLERLEKFEEELCRDGCPAHKGIVEWIKAAEQRREDGDNKMNAKFDKMFWMQFGTLLAAVGGLLAALWRATGHAG